MKNLELRNSGRNRSGVVDPLSLVVIGLAAVGIGLLSGWKPFQFLKPKPPVEQVTKLQGQLAQAQADLEATRKAAEEAKATERAKFEQQIRAAQEDNLGAGTALARVAPEHRTAETKLAAAMTQRVTLKLAAAIGDLPREQQDAMIALIDQALSDKQAEIDAANAKLAERDAEFKIVVQERDAAKAQIPVLVAKVQDKEAAVNQVQEKLTEKTNEVTAWAKAKDAADRAAGTIGASFNRFVTVAAWAVGIWAFLVYVLPGIVKHLEAGRLKTTLRDVSGFVTSPLLYLDARKKLAAANATSATP